MTITVGFHFHEIPSITHKDFPNSQNPFTVATLTDNEGHEHYIYLPCNARITVSQKEQSHE